MRRGALRTGPHIQIMSTELHQGRARSPSVDGIRQKQARDMNGAKIAVIGLDPDGFSLAGRAASFGFQTIGFDPDEVKVAQLQEYAAERGERNLLITSDASHLRDADIFIISVPIDYSGGSGLGPLKSAAETVGRCMRDGSFVIVESIVFPGVCEHIVLPALEKQSGLSSFSSARSQSAFFFAHLPASRDRLQRTIGASDAESLSRAIAFCRSLDIDTIALRSIKEAEAVRMVEDSLHDVALAVSNEFSILFDRLGIDMAHIAKAVKGSVAISAGIGLPYTQSAAYYLSRSGHEHELEQQFLATARRIAEYMPTYAVNVLEEALEEERISLSGAVVAVLGISNGAGFDELGVGAKIRSVLERRGAQVRAYDPDIAGAGFDLKETLEGAHAAIVASDRPMFRSLAPRQFEELGVQVVIDARNALDKDAFGKSPVAYRGIGRG